MSHSNLRGSAANGKISRAGKVKNDRRFELERLEDRQLLYGSTVSAALSAAALTVLVPQVDATAAPQADAAVIGRTLYVSTTGNNANTGLDVQHSLQTINAAINLAQAGDTVLVADGIYREMLLSVRSGAADGRITIKAANAGGATITMSGRCVDFSHAYLGLEGLVFDGQFGPDDMLIIRAGSNNLIVRNCEIRNGARDGIDMATTQNVLVDNCRIHDMLWMQNGVRQDAHGIVTNNATDFTIQNTEIYYVSGDAFQAIYGTWDRIRIVGCKFWNGPLQQATAGFAAGINPGENAVDTKKYATQARGHISMENSQFYGWKSSLIGNSAALNLKQNIDAVVSGCVLYGNEIAFRVRGPSATYDGAYVTAINNVIYNNLFAVRYEDALQNFKLLNNTFGSGNSTVFIRAGADGKVGWSVLNNVFLGTAKPAEASDASNYAVAATSFVNAAGNDYHLVAGATPIDKAVSTAGLVPTWFAASGKVDRDRDGVLRPQGSAADAGAYERATVVSGAVGIQGPVATVRGKPTNYLLTVSNAVANEVFTFNIDFNGDGNVDQAVVGVSGVTASLMFANLGTNNLRVTALRSSGTLAAEKILAVNVSAWALEVDPTNSSKTNLVWGGTFGGDSYTFINGGVNTQMENGQVFTQPKFTSVGAFNGKVIVYGRTGDDYLTADSISSPVEFYGGDGDDVLYGGRGGDLLDGGNGNDLIFGGPQGADGDDTIWGAAGNDVIVAGSGVDKITGGAGADLIIQDPVFFANNYAAMRTIQSIWLTPGSREEKIAILTGTGSTPPPASQPTLVKNVTVLSDGLVDSVFNSDSLDWIV